MPEVMSLSMASEADIGALQGYLRRMYRTEEHACCQSLLSLSYVGFERQCRAAVRGGGGASFCAHVCDGLKLEYSSCRVVVKRAWLGLPAEAPQKRRFCEVSDAESPYL